MSWYHPCCPHTSSDLVLPFICLCALPRCACASPPALLPLRCSPCLPRPTTTSCIAMSVPCWLVLRSLGGGPSYVCACVCMCVYVCVCVMAWQCDTPHLRAPVLLFVLLRSCVVSHQGSAGAEAPAEPSEEEFAAAQARVMARKAGAGKAGATVKEDAGEAGVAVASYLCCMLLVLCCLLCCAALPWCVTSTVAVYWSPPPCSELSFSIGRCVLLSKLCYTWFLKICMADSSS